VRGEAGIGKSRLVQELLQRARTRGYACHRALVLDFGSGIAGGAIPVLTRALLGVPGGEAAERVGAAVQQVINAGWVSHGLAPFLYELLELPLPGDPSDGAQAVDRDARARGHQAVLNSLVRARSASSPLLLVVEDVHWADRTTLETLARAAAAARDLPLVLALTTRPEPETVGPAWRAASGGCPLLTLDLAPLTQAEARELAGTYPCEDDALVASCVQRAEGNPLFLDQLMRNAQSGDRTLPSSIQSIVLARLDRLDPGDRQALQAASILGQRFTLEAVQSLTSIACSCEEMVARGLVRPEGQGYIFNHALIHEAVYASLLRSRRHELHLRAAAWFAARDPVLHAQHLDAASNSGAAAAYLRAAQAEADRHQYDRALRLCERGSSWPRSNGCSSRWGACARRSCGSWARRRLRSRPSKPQSSWPRMRSSVPAPCSGSPPACASSIVTARRWRRWTPRKSRHATSAIRSSWHRSTFSAVTSTSRSGRPMRAWPRTSRPAPMPCRQRLPRWRRGHWAASAMHTTCAERSRPPANTSRAAWRLRASMVS
jgi:predicted ATPase